MPGTHSFRQAGAYPLLPDFLLSKRLAYTSSRPRKRLMNSKIFSEAGESLVTTVLAAGGLFGRQCSTGSWSSKSVSAAGYSDT